MEQRICVVCSKPIGVMRRGIYCGRTCSQVAAADRKPAKEVAGWLIHSCHSPDLNEPLPPHCKCKKRVNDPQMRHMLANAEIVELFGHPGEFGYSGRRKQTPRTPSIERSHIERSVVTRTPKERRLSQSQIDELLRMREETKLSFEEEARCRWDEYNRITQEWLNSLIVPFREDPFDGRCVFSSGIGDDTRTSVGKTVDREYLPDVFEQEEVEGEVVERDENVVTLEETEDVEELEYAEVDT